MADRQTSSDDNPLGINGIDFVEFTSPDPAELRSIFTELGFSRLKRHKDYEDLEYYRQNGIHFLVNERDEGFASNFRADHGPSICSMGLRVDDATEAFENATSRGADPAESADKDLDLPAIWGIGNSLVYFVEEWGDEGALWESRFEDLDNPDDVPTRGFMLIDHLTNNVYQGDKEKWADFYKQIFGFEEIRYFDIKGKKTGLTSYALRSPCGTFALPINEASDEKSQIQEYLDEYNGPGIQHLALQTNDLLESLDQMEGGSIETLDIIDSYYDEVFDRVPNVKEDHERIEYHDVLVDGDEDGYLLQIFTKNCIGPIFFELIQRNNHKSFGEGNFQALFESIERDQERRGVL